MKGETFIWRDSIKNKVEEYKYSVFMIMSSQYSGRVRKFIFNWKEHDFVLPMLKNNNLETTDFYLQVITCCHNALDPSFLNF